MAPDERLYDLLLLWEEQTEAGRKVAAEELCRDCPELLPELRRHMAALGQVAWVAQLARPSDNGLRHGHSPVPGCRLVSPLGRGGFGQVWRAAGPDGSDIALKFLPRGSGSTNAERRAFESLRGVRHRNLIAMVGYWETDDCLVLGMELADRTLHDRLVEAQTSGLSGIPTAELFDFMRQAAAGIDHLHAAAVQHRDIKPQNLLLKSGVVKVADFGLARTVVHTVTGHTGTLTLHYAAPEFFDGKASRHSDQYSLAITYCQLRDGRLPFDGTAAQVMAGHISREPDLTMLSGVERRVVARALAKRPEDRWPSCSAFAEALAGAARGQNSSVGRTFGKRGWVVTAVLAVASLIAFGISTRLWPREQESQSAEPHSPQPPPAQHGVAPGPRFVFNGRARIITPLERFAPVTLEAWVNPGRPSGGRWEKAVIGSDIPTKSGISMSLDYRTWDLDPLLGAQVLPSPNVPGVQTNAPVRAGRWTHLAVAFGHTETHLFIDGKRVAGGAVSGTTGGTPFVVGNQGKDNPEHYYVGEMRAVRISRGARYREDFDPPATFVPDEAAVLIYDAGHTRGDVAADLSGKGNHGAMERVEVRQ